MIHDNGMYDNKSNKIAIKICNTGTQYTHILTRYFTQDPPS